MATAKCTEKLKTLLKCPICQEKLNQPRAFECLHFYCKSCIDGMSLATKGAETGLKCPVCRQKTPADKIRPMRFVNDLLEVVDLAKKEERSCDRCKTDVATHRCVECKVFHCSKCKDEHDTHPFLMQHTWKDVSNGTQAIMDKHVYCPYHPSELVKFHCKDCSEVICLICNGTKHKNHQAESIEEALERLVPSVKAQKEVLQKKIQDNKVLLGSLITRSCELENGYNEVEADINKKYDEVMRKVLNDKKKCIQQVRDIKDRQMNIIQKSIRTEETKLKSQTSIVALSETTLSTAKGTSLLQTIQNDVKESLDAVIKEDTLVDPDLFDIEAHFEPVVLNDNLIGAVSRIMPSTAKINSKVVPRPLNERVYVIPKFVKSVHLGYNCYRFSIIDEQLWCIHHGTNIIDIYDLDGTKMRLVRIDGIHQCQAVAKLAANVFIVATTDGLVRMNQKFQLSNVIIIGDIADVTVASDTAYALDKLKRKIHIFRLKEKRFVSVKEIHLNSINPHWLNSIVATSESIFLSEFNCHTITQFDMAGNVVRRFGKHGSGDEAFHRPMVCGIDSKGCLLIVDNSNECLKVFNHGALTTMKVNGLHYPMCAGFVKDRLFVTEDGARSLKIFLYV